MEIGLLVIKSFTLHFSTISFLKKAFASPHAFFSFVFSTQNEDIITCLCLPYFLP